MIKDNKGREGKTQVEKRRVFYCQHQDYPIDRIDYGWVTMDTVATDFVSD